MQIKREITMSVDQLNLIAKILGCGYFLYVQKNQDNLVFKRKAVSSDGFQMVYQRFNPFNMLYVEIHPKKVLIVIYLGKILGFLLLLNVLFLFLLFMAGIPAKGLIFLPTVFFLLQVLLVFFYSHLKIADIAEKLK